MQLQLNISFNEDDVIKIIHATNGVDAGRVFIDRFLLWLPKLTPKDSLYSKFLKEEGLIQI